MVIFDINARGSASTGRLDVYLYKGTSANDGVRVSEAISSVQNSSQGINTTGEDTVWVHMSPGDWLSLGAHRSTSNLGWYWGWFSVLETTSSSGGGSGTIPQPSSSDPIRDGASAQVGTSDAYARGDHRHQDKAITLSDLPAGATRDTEVENFAKVGNSATFPAAKFAPDIFTPAMLNADTVSEKQDFRKKIDAAAAGAVSVPFHDTITFTSGVALDGEHHGFDSTPGGGYGSTTDSRNFEDNNITYQVRECSQISGEVEVTITPDPPTDAKWTVTVNGHELRFSDATIINSLEYGTDGTLYQWQNQSLDVVHLVVALSSSLSVMLLTMN